MGGLPWATMECFYGGILAFMPLITLVNVYLQNNDVIFYKIIDGV